MDETSQPGPYIDVNLVLDRFLAQVQAILGDRFVGMYLAGSLALGDFDPASSDIDLVVVTEGHVPDDRFALLHALHTRFAASGSPWADRVEAVYIARAALRDSRPVDASYPLIERGQELVREPLESAWVVQCWTLREHGVVLAGPAPATLIGPVDPDALRRVSARIAEGWHEQAQADPDWLDWLRHRSDHAFVVLTLCRLLYTLETGTVASKPGAARWAQQGTARPWAALITRALGGRQATGEISASEMDDTLTLLRYTVERFAQWETGASEP